MVVVAAVVVVVVFCLFFSCLLFLFLTLLLLLLLFLLFQVGVFGSSVFAYYAALWLRAHPVRSCVARDHLVFTSVLTCAG